MHSLRRRHVQCFQRYDGVHAVRVRFVLAQHQADTEQYLSALHDRRLLFGRVVSANPLSRGHQPRLPEADVAVELLTMHSKYILRREHNNTYLNKQLSGRILLSSW